MARAPATENTSDAPGIPEQPSGADPAQQMEVKCTGSFFENPNMSGRLLQAGDVFVTDRLRAAELRANGLVSYTNEEAEKTAAADDLPPSTDQGQVVITSRSIRRPK